jgi:predicted dehydrogenase
VPTGGATDFDFAGEDRWLNFSSHSFDLVRYWAGREPKRIAAWHRPLAGDRYLLAVWLDFEDLAAQVWDELASATTLRWQFRLMGDGGSVRGHEAYFGDMMPAEVAYTPAGETTEHIKYPGTSYVPDAFATYFEALVDAVREGTEPPSTGRNTLRTLRLAFAAGKSARTGGWIDPGDLDPTEMSL